MNHFPPVTVSDAKNDRLGNFVGRVMLAGNRFCYAPGSGKPCVYYRTTVEEEFVTERRDQNGNTTTTRQWRQIGVSENYCDFYLVNGNDRLFISGSQRDQVKIQSNTDSPFCSFKLFNLPPGIKQMIGFSLRNFSWSQTGNYRYREQSFDLNEILAAFGVPKDTQDYYTQQPVKYLVPYDPNTLTQQYFTENKWEDHDIEAWKEFAKAPTVLVSDDRKHTSKVQVAPLVMQVVAVNWDTNTFQFDQGWQRR